MNAVIDNLVALAEHWSSKAMSAREAGDDKAYEFASGMSYGLLAAIRELKASQGPNL
jgi:hypothetical protein